MQFPQKAELFMPMALQCDSNIGTIGGRQVGYNVLEYLNTLLWPTCISMKNVHKDFAGKN